MPQPVGRGGHGKLQKIRTETNETFVVPHEKGVSELDICAIFHSFTERERERECAQRRQLSEKWKKR